MLEHASMREILVLFSSVHRLNRSSGGHWDDSAEVFFQSFQWDVMCREQFWHWHVQSNTNVREILTWGKC